MIRSVVGNAMDISGTDPKGRDHPKQWSMTSTSTELINVVFSYYIMAKICLLLASPSR